VTPPSFSLVVVSALRHSSYRRGSPSFQRFRAHLQPAVALSGVGLTSAGRSASSSRGW
jgi:hypothetical protein